MADEASFIDLVIASERIGTWIDVIRQPPSRSRLVIVLSFEPQSEKMVLAMIWREVFAFNQHVSAESYQHSDLFGAVSCEQCVHLFKS